MVIVTIWRSLSVSTVKVVNNCWTAVLLITALVTVFHRFLMWLSQIDIYIYIMLYIIYCYIYNFMLSWKQCALLVTTTMALWQLIHLGTWCMIYIHILYSCVALQQQAAYFSSHLLNLLWNDHVQCYDYLQSCTMLWWWLSSKIPVKSSNCTSIKPPMLKNEPTFVSIYLVSMEAGDVNCFDTSSSFSSKLGKQARPVICVKK